MKKASASTAHTSGPWIARANGVGQWMIELRDYSCIATVGDGIHDGDSPETLAANAHLIAAAPELLDAAKSMCVWFECLIETPEWNGDKDDYLKLKKAIAKAEGRAHESSPIVP